MSYTKGQLYAIGNEVRLKDGEGFCRLVCQCSRHPDEREESESNAKLFACAPEMLDSLKELRSILLSTQDYFAVNGHADRFEQITAAYNKVHTIITKAAN